MVSPRLACTTYRSDISTVVVPVGSSPDVGLRPWAAVYSVRVAYPGLTLALVVSRPSTARPRRNPRDWKAQATSRRPPRGEGRQGRAGVHAASRDRRSRRARRVGLKWAAVVGLVGLLLAWRGRVRRRSTSRPTSRTPTRTSRPRPRSSTTPTARPSSARYATQNRDSIPRRDAAARQGRGGRRGGPPSGPTRASTPRASSARVQQRQRQRDPGARRRSPSSTSRSSTSPRSAPTTARSRRRSSRSSSSELSKEQILEGYLNTIYFGRGAYGIEAAARRSSTRTPRTSTCASARCWPPCSTTRALRPGQRQGDAPASRSATPTSSAAWPTTGAITASEADEAEQAAAEVPQDRGREPVRRPARPSCSRWSRKELNASGFTDAEIDGGGLRVTTTFTPEGDGGRRGRRLEQRPEGFDGAARRRSRPSSRHRCAARLLRRPGLPRLPDQLGRRGRHGRGRRSSRSRSRPRSPTASRSRTPSRATPRSRSPTATDFENQGEARTTARRSRWSAGHRGLGQHRLRRHGRPHGRRPAEGRRHGRSTWASPGQGPGGDHLRDLEPTTGVALGSATVSPIDMANAYATIANGGVAADVFVIDKVVDRNGETIYPTRSTRTRAHRPRHRLRRLLRPAAGRRRTAPATPKDRPPAAGKTGTATNDKGNVASSWFVGYTPQLATAVMYFRGNGNDPLNGYLEPFFGGDYPARTWPAIMDPSARGGRSRTSRRRRSSTADRRGGTSRSPRSPPTAAGADSAPAAQPDGDALAGADHEPPEPIPGADAGSAQPDRVQPARPGLPAGARSRPRPTPSRRTATGTATAA